jgi:hypothetical protein
MNYRILLTFAIVVLTSFITIAQNVSTTSVTTEDGVKITTKITPQPTLSDQVKYLEKMLEEAEKNPEMHKNGTVKKYKLSLEDRRKKLAIELEEKNKIESQKK